MNNHTCFDQVAKRWDGPIEKPVSWDRETGEMSAKWMIKVFKYTKSGNISRSGGGWLNINYCPICGDDLRE